MDVAPSLYKAALTVIMRTETKHTTSSKQASDTITKKLLAKMLQQKHAKIQYKKFCRRRKKSPLFDKTGANLKVH